MAIKKFNVVFTCDTMWVVHQADDPFVCFGAKPNKGLSSRSLTRPEVGEKRPVGKGTQRGAVGKGTQRGSVGEERRRERTAEGTSQDELAVQSGQRSAEGGSEEDDQRWVGIPSGFCRSFAKKYTPSDSLQDARKAVQKGVTKLPFLHLKLT